MDLYALDTLMMLLAFPLAAFILYWYFQLNPPLCG